MIDILLSALSCCQAAGGDGTATVVERVEDDVAATLLQRRGWLEADATKGKCQLGSRPLPRFAAGASLPSWSVEVGPGVALQASLRLRRGLPTLTVQTDVPKERPDAWSHLPTVLV